MIKNRREKLFYQREKTKNQREKPFYRREMIKNHREKPFYRREKTKNQREKLFYRGTKIKVQGTELFYRRTKLFYRRFFQMLTHYSEIKFGFIIPWLGDLPTGQAGQTGVLVLWGINTRFKYFM